MAKHYYTYTGTDMQRQSVFEIYRHSSGKDIRVGDVTNASEALELCRLANKGESIVDKLTYLGPAAVEELTRRELEGQMPLMCAIGPGLKVTPLYESDFF